MLAAMDATPSNGSSVPNFALAPVAAWRQALRGLELSLTDRWAPLNAQAICELKAQAICDRLLRVDRALGRNPGLARSWP